MPWFEVTTVDGHKLYINSDEMVYMAPFQWAEGEGARLVTTTTDKDGKPIVLTVREPAAEIYGWFSAVRPRA